MNLAAWRRRFWLNAIDPERPFASLARLADRLRQWAANCCAIYHGRPEDAPRPRLHSFGSTSIFIKRDQYEPELLAVGRLNEPGSVVLDIGGSFGNFALLMAHFAGPHGKVHSFEPGRFTSAAGLTQTSDSDPGRKSGLYDAWKLHDLAEILFRTHGRPLISVIPVWRGNFCGERNPKGRGKIDFRAGA